MGGTGGWLMGNGGMGGAGGVGGNGGAGGQALLFGNGESYLDEFSHIGRQVGRQRRRRLLDVLHCHGQGTSASRGSSPELSR